MKAYRNPEWRANISASLRARTKPSKVCPKCGGEFSRETFGTRKNGATKTYCPPCQRAVSRAKSNKHHRAHPTKTRARNRATSLRRLHGITPNDYHRLGESQEWRCAICRTHQDELTKRLFVDHCHETGVIRGLLCNGCNAALGLMKDRPDVLRAAAEYLERPVPDDALYSQPAMPSGFRDNGEVVQESEYDQLLLSDSGAA